MASLLDFLYAMLNLRSPAGAAQYIFDDDDDDDNDNDNDDGDNNEYDNAAGTGPGTAAWRHSSSPGTPCRSPWRGST